MKYANYLLLATLTVLLVAAALALPEPGAVRAPLHAERSAASTPGASHYYIQNAFKDAHTPNMVTVILADYRGFDTLGETIVVFTAGIACALILRRTT